MTLNTQKEKEPLRRRASTPLASAHLHQHAPWARDPQYPACSSTQPCPAQSQPQTSQSQPQSTQCSQSQPYQSQPQSTQSSQSQRQSSQSESEPQSTQSSQSQSAQSQSSKSQRSHPPLGQSASYHPGDKSLYYHAQWSSDSDDDSQSDSDCVYHVVLLGDHAVGKTSLAGIFAGVTDKDEQSAEDTYERTLTVDGQETTLIVMDTWENDKLEGEDSSVQDHCLKVGSAYVIVYSVTDRSSFDSAAELRITLRRARQAENLPIILVGNKSDLVRCREVAVEEGRACAVVFDCKFIETSASLQHNVAELFEGVVRQIRLRRDGTEAIRHRHSIYKRKESLTQKARRFLDRLVARNNQRMAVKVRSKSCHDLAVL